MDHEFSFVPLTSTSSPYSYFLCCFNLMRRYTYLKQCENNIPGQCKTLTSRPTTCRYCFQVSSHPHPWIFLPPPSLLPPSFLFFPNSSTTLPFSPLSTPCPFSHVCCSVFLSFMREILLATHLSHFGRIYHHPSQSP